MKKVLKTTIFVLIICFSSFAQSDYKYYYSSNGVNFYSKRNAYNENQIDIKAENTNYYKVEITINEFEWLYNGIVVNDDHGNGATFNLNPGETKSGEKDGLWWQCPTKYDLNNLRFRLRRIEINRK